MNLINQLQHHFPTLEFKTEQSLAPFSTVKIGGPAEVFLETKNSDDFIKVVTFAKIANIPLTIIGWGANSLISDKGIRGLVIKNSASNIQLLDENINPEKIDHLDNDLQKTMARWDKDDNQSPVKYDFHDLDYNEYDKPAVRVRLDSGVALPFAINYLLEKGITGLQWYSRIPATIGGAIYNNIHGGTHFIAEVIESVTVIDQNGQIKVIENKELEAGYDYSRFHKSREIIVYADFILRHGDKERAKIVAREWAIRKAIQPHKSLGCVFQNISKDEQQKHSLKTPSVGYIVEHVLQMKGFRVGDAMVSEKHAAFIENMGNATAGDYLKIIKLIVQKTKEKLDINLKPEIFFLGFEKNELEGLNLD